MPDLMESVAGNLQQRIGQLVSEYETNIAILKANAAKQLEEKDNEIKFLKDQLEADAQGRKAPDVQEAVPAPTDPAEEPS